jgi:hypothetical protein
MSYDQQLADAQREIAALRARVERAEEVGADKMLTLISGLYPGVDRQSLDAVIRGLQDKYGPRHSQVRAAAALSEKEEGKPHE